MFIRPRDTRQFIGIINFFVDTDTKMQHHIYKHNIVIIIINVVHIIYDIIEGKNRTLMTFNYYSSS